MNNNTTIEKMKQMRLTGMPEAHYGSVQSANYQDYTIDQYLAMLIDQAVDNLSDFKVPLNQQLLPNYIAHQYLEFGRVLINQGCS